MGMVRVLLASHLLTFVSGNICKDGTGVGDESFKKHKDDVDKISGVMFLVDSSIYKYTCCGLVRQFKSYAMEDGDIYYLIWRPLEEKGKYKVVGVIKSVLTDTPRSSSLLPSSGIQPEVIPGDLLGWYSPGSSSVPFISSKTDGQSYILSSDLPELGDVVDWSSSDVEVHKKRIYAVDSVVNSVTNPPEFKNVVESADIETTADVGAVVYKVTVTDRQYQDTVVTLSGSPMFELNMENQVIVASQLAVGSYDLVVTAANLCDLSSSITTTVIVNEPATDPPTELPTDPPTAPPTDPPTDPVTDPVTNPPTDHVTDPTTNPTDPQTKQTDPIIIPTDHATPETTSEMTQRTDAATTGYKTSNVPLLTTEGPPTTTGNGTMVMDMSDEPDDGWKYGVGFSVTIILLIVLSLFLYCWWKWKKRYQVTKPKDELEKGEGTKESDVDAKDGDAGDDKQDSVKETKPLENNV